MKIIKIISLFLLLVFSFNLFANEGITVSGTAKISVTPDMATFSFAINERGIDLVKLKEIIDKKSINMVNLGKKLGIKIKDINTSEVSIHPNYNYETKKLITYEVSRNIKVILKDLNNYSKLVDGMIGLGITRIDSVNMDKEDRAEVENKMLGAAIEEANKKAKIIAEKSNTKLGRIISVSEKGIVNRVENYQFRGMMDASPSPKQGAFEPGEIVVTSSIIVNYEISY